MKPKFIGSKVPHNPNALQLKSSSLINSIGYQDNSYYNTNETSNYNNSNLSNQSNASSSCSPSSTSSVSSSSSSSSKRGSNLLDDNYFKEGTNDYDYQAHLNYLNFTNQQLHHHQQKLNKLIPKTKQGINMNANDSIKDSLINKSNDSLNKLNNISFNRYNGMDDEKMNPSSVSPSFIINTNMPSTFVNSNQKLIDAIYNNNNNNSNSSVIGGPISCNKNDNLNPKTSLYTSTHPPQLQEQYYNNNKLVKSQVIISNSYNNSNHSKLAILPTLIAPKLSTPPNGSLPLPVTLNTNNPRLLNSISKSRSPSPSAISSSKSSNSFYLPKQNISIKSGDSINNLNKTAPLSPPIGSPLNINLIKQGKLIMPPPTTAISMQLPQQASCGAKQLSKLKRFLTTLQQFASDISPEIGDRVRNLVLSLVNSGITIEDFHSKLQEATNFPLRPFVIPFLKANLPLLQRELLHFAKMSKTNATDYINQNVENILNYQNDMNDEPHNTSHIHSSKHLNSSYSSEIENNNSGGGFKRKSVDDSDLNRSQDSTKNDSEFIPPQPYKYQRNSNNSKSVSQSNPFYSTPTPPPLPSSSSTSSSIQGSNQSVAQSQSFYHQQQLSSAAANSQIPFSFVLPTPPSPNNPNMFGPPYPPSNNQLASHNQISKPPIASSANHNMSSQLLSHLNYSNTQSANNYFQNSNSTLPHNLNNQQPSPLASSNSNQSKFNQPQHYSTQSPLSTNSNTINTSTQDMRDFEQDYCEISEKNLDDEFKNIDETLNSIVEMINRTKRAVNSMQTRTIKLRKQIDSYENELKRRNEDLRDEPLEVDERIKEIKKKADNLVNDVKRQSYLDLQKAISAAEQKANDIVVKEREKFEIILKEAQKEYLNENFRQEDNETKNCWNCGRKAFETCSGCHEAKYCTQFCQHKHWNLIHHKLCISAKTSNKIDEEISFEQVDDEQEEKINESTESETEKHDNINKSCKEKSHGKKLNELAKKLNDSINTDINLEIEERIKQDDKEGEGDNEKFGDGFEKNQENIENNNDSITNKSEESNHFDGKKQENSAISSPSLSRSSSPTSFNNEKI